jgi:ABC-2 type transport system permease protein
MNKTWIMIKYEYRKYVLRKGFLLALFSVPIWIVLSIGLGLLSVVLTNNSTPIGYVDLSGVLSSPIALPVEKSIVKDPEIIPFPSESQAKLALNEGKIQVYYVLPIDYPENRKLNVYFMKEPKSQISDHFEKFLQLNLIKVLPKATSNRVLEGSTMEVHATEEKRQSGGMDWFKIAAPLFGAALLLTSVFTSSGYLMRAIVDEKENRTMEILATSLSPIHIMTGKVLALVAVGLTQVVGWCTFGLVGILVGQKALPTMLTAAIDWGTIGMILAMVIPTIVMMSAMMAAIGATVTEASEGQQVSGFVTLPIMIPFMMMGVFLSNSDSPLSLFLTFFPPTSSMTILLRSAFGSVPTWQIYVVALELIGAAILSLVIAGRIFRAGMLQYGKRMNIKDVMMAIRRTG